MLGQKEKKTVLVVDDEKDIVEGLERVLSRRNFQVITALNGAQALEMALHHKPALIILDIMLPDIDGKDVARRLMEDKATRKIPIIFLSGVATGLEVRHGQIYQQQLLTKPASIKEILAAIQKVFPELDVNELIAPQRHDRD